MKLHKIFNLREEVQEKGSRSDKERKRIRAWQSMIERKGEINRKLQKSDPIVMLDNVYPKIIK